MKEIEKRYEVARLISQELTGKITREERERLDNWLACREECGQEYEQIKLRLKKELQEEKRPDVVKEWKYFERKVEVRSRKTFRIWPYVAAACVGVCVLIGVLYFRQQPSHALVVENINETRSYKALLILGNGERVAIGDSSALVINEGTGTKIRTENNVLRYEDHGVVGESPEEWNTVVVPRGAEYELLLSDGTKVWLNSESQLTYPVKFTGNMREVKMNGEICFEVFRNEQQPFVVKAGDVSVKVLGTFFNIEAYPENHGVITTLVNGKVEVAVGEVRTILQPNEQAIVDEGQAVRIEQVYAGDYVSWTTGVFHFTQASLEDIMTKLARWYNIEFFFAAPGLKEAHFSLDIQRYDHVSEILSKIEKTGRVKFRTKGSIVVIEE